MVAQGEPIGGEGGVVIPLALEGERFIEVVQSLGLEIAATASEHTLPESHPERGR
jgi:hypothetical protein